LKASKGISKATDRPGAPPRNEPSSSSTAKRFTLSGPSLPLDERVHAYRRDIADIALAGQLFAPHYARPLIRSCGSRPSFVRPKPADEASPSSELLPGEEFAVLEVSGGWAWGYCRADHYVGYVENIALVDTIAATHLIAASSAPIYAEPDDRTPALASLTMGSRLAGHEQSGFLATDLGFIAFTHVRPVGAVEHDPVGVATRMLGTPYLLGGRSIQGIDCSGLVQLSLALCGIRAPRDSDQQRVLGYSLGAKTELERGDLIFFEGHVGLMTGTEELIHATGFRGETVVEPLATVAKRTAIVDRRRLAA
jgi:cell wall-associated NlpC family hydrolase